MTYEEYVLVSVLALEFGLDRSNARKWIKRQRVEPFRVRTTDSGGQLELAVTPEEADCLRRSRQEQGFSVGGEQSTIGATTNGYFYVIQLIPELDTSRVKLGFAINVNNRLAAHRTTCPRATVLRQWPCRFAWEVAAIACATRVDCLSLSNEVYTCDDLGSLVARLDALFGNLPPPDFR